MKDKNTRDKIFEVPVEGSLGLLAMGAVGLKAWRAKRLEANKDFKANDKK